MHFRAGGVSACTVDRDCTDGAVELPPPGGWGERPLCDSLEVERGQASRRCQLGRWRSQKGKRRPSGARLGPGVALKAQRPKGAVGEARARFDSRVVLNLAGGGGVGFGKAAFGRQIVSPGAAFKAQRPVGGSAHMAGSRRATALVTCHRPEWPNGQSAVHEIGFARVFKLGLWQLHLRVGIGAAAQSYSGMPGLATWAPTRRSHQAASRSQARAYSEVF